MAALEFIASGEAENTGETYKTEMRTRHHVLIADEPVAVGGEDKGPAPGDYLCMSVASCKVITMRMYANRKNWKVDSIKVKVSLVKGAAMETGNNTFFSEINIVGEISEENKIRMMEIANACPINKLLSKPSDFISQQV